MADFVCRKWYFAEHSEKAGGDGEAERREADETLRMRAMPERLMKADPASEMTPVTVDAPGLGARDPAVKEDARLMEGAGVTCLWRRV